MNTKKFFSNKLSDIRLCGQGERSSKSDGEGGKESGQVDGSVDG